MLMVVPCYSIIILNIFIGELPQQLVVVDQLGSPVQNLECTILTKIKVDSEMTVCNLK